MPPPDVLAAPPEPDAVVGAALDALELPAAS